MTCRDVPRYEARAQRGEPRARPSGGALAACAAGGRETIRFALAKPEAIPYMRELVEEYNGSQDEVEVVLDTSGVDAFSAGFVRGDPPDIALNNYNQETARFIQRCAMSDLSDTEAAQSVREDLNPFMEQFGVCPGRTSAIPYSIMGAAVIYNKEIFEQNDLDVPTTLGRAHRGVRDPRGSGGHAVLRDLRRQLDDRAGLVRLHRGRHARHGRVLRRARRRRAPKSGRTRRSRSRRIRPNPSTRCSSCRST